MLTKNKLPFNCHIYYIDFVVCKCDVTYYVKTDGYMCAHESMYTRSHHTIKLLVNTFVSTKYNYYITNSLFIRSADLCIILLQDLTVTDDTVLEEHNEDPALVQMRLIGDGGK